MRWFDSVQQWVRPMNSKNQKAEKGRQAWGCRGRVHKWERMGKALICVVWKSPFAVHTEGDARAEAESCTEEESTEAPLLEFEAGGSLLWNGNSLQSRCQCSRRGWGLQPEWQRAWEKGLNAKGAFSWLVLQGTTKILSKRSFKMKKKTCIYWQRKWTQHGQLCMTSPYNIFDYESFLFLFHYLLFCFS